MRFDPASQKLVCRHCGSAVNPHDYDTEHAIHAEEGSGFSEDTYEATLMTCPQCGGELLTTDDTAATFCSFCGSSVLLNSRVSHEKRPDYIIPFKKTREDCLQAYRATLKRSLYAPSDMFREEQIEHFRGIYMPYWVYSFNRNSRFSARGKTEHRRGDYIITKNYQVDSHVDASYDGLSFDGSSSFSDNLSEAIAPFEFSDGESFAPGFLSGFYADTNDVASSVYKSDAETIAKAHAADALSRSRAYQRYGIDEGDLERSLHLDAGKPKLAMYPVWFLACRNKRGDRVSYAVVNGQTGKVAADLPVDKKKMLLGTIILAIPIFLILNLLLTLTPGKALIISIIIGLIGMILANRQMNLIYCFENKLDDKGYMSLHDPWDTSKKKEPVQLTFQAGALRTILVVIACIILFGVVAMLDIPGGAIIIFFVMFGLIKTIIKPAEGRRKKSAAIKKAVQPAPFSEKIKTLWKPIVGIVASLVIVVIAPVSDLYYYAAAFVSMIFIAWSFWDILSMHNRLTTRPLPQFGKRGGEEYENR